MNTKLIPFFTSLVVTLMLSTPSEASSLKFIDAEVVCIGGITPLFPIGGHDSPTVIRYAPEDLKENDKGGFSIKGLSIRLDSYETEASKQSEWLAGPDGVNRLNPNYKRVIEYSAEIVGRISLHCTSGRLMHVKELTLGKSAHPPEALKE